jgi:hypothetical protein
MWALRKPQARPPNPLRADRPQRAVALAATIAAAVALLSSATAYASPGPTVTKPTASSVTAARAACRSVHSAGPLAAKATEGKLVLTDSLGRYTAVLLVGNDVLKICISRGPREVGIEGANLGVTAMPGPDQLAGYGGGGETARGFDGGDGDGNLAGRAGSDVVGLKFIFANGATVDAIVRSGFYFAWWSYRLDGAHGSLSPSSHPTSVEITTKSGKTARSPMSCRTDACIFVPLNPSHRRAL